MQRTLHQQLEQRRLCLAADKVTAKSVHADPRDAYEAEQRVKRYAEEIKKLEAAIAFGEEAERLFEKALGMIGNVAEIAGGRDLALSQTYGETAVWRLQRHLGTAAKGGAI